MVCSGDASRRYYQLAVRRFLASEHPFTREGVTNYLVALRRKGRKPTTINMQLTALRQFIRVAISLNALAATHDLFELVFLLTFDDIERLAC